MTSSVQVKGVPMDRDDPAAGYSVGSLEKPTTRLSQYARGKTGSMNPFTPGGDVSDEIGDMAIPARQD